MTDWSKRDFSLSLDFLDEGIYNAGLCVDGVNAETYPSDYVIKDFTLQRNVPLLLRWLRVVFFY